MKLPPNTCPQIDSVIEEINSAIKIAAKCYDSLDDAENALGDIIWALNGLEDKLEIIREANGDLRQAAEEENAAKEEAEKEVSMLVKENLELISEIDRLKEIEWMYNDLE